MAAHGRSQSSYLRAGATLKWTVEELPLGRWKWRNHRQEGAHNFFGSWSLARIVHEVLSEQTCLTSRLQWQMSSRPSQWQSDWPSANGPGSWGLTAWTEPFRWSAPSKSPSNTSPPSAARCSAMPGNHFSSHPKVRKICSSNLKTLLENMEMNGVKARPRLSKAWGSAAWTNSRRTSHFFKDKIHVKNGKTNMKNEKIYHMLWKKKATWWTKQLLWECFVRLWQCATWWLPKLLHAWQQHPTTSRYKSGS